MSEQLEDKQSKKKDLLIGYLKKAPIVQLACERADVGRATFYRWKKDDTEFASAVDEALTTGSSLINDMAESKLISAIQNQNLSAIVFWLKHHHPAYTTKVELALGTKQNDELTAEQQEIVREALTKAALINPSNILSESYEN